MRWLRRLFGRRGRFRRASFCDFKALNDTNALNDPNELNDLNELNVLNDPNDPNVLNDLNLLQQKAVKVLWTLTAFGVV